MQLNKDYYSTSSVVEKTRQPLDMAKLRELLNGIEPAKKSVIITTRRGLADIKNEFPENQIPSANLSLTGVPIKVFADENVASASAVLAWAEGYTVVLFLPERNMLKVYE